MLIFMRIKWKYYNFRMRMLERVINSDISNCEKTE